MMINTEGFFNDIYKNACENSVIILDQKGVILQVSPSFITAFGYKRKDVIGKHFRMLFTKKDRLIKRPESEVKTALLEGSKSDDNYLVQKDGTPIWVMGESFSVINTANEKYLVKIIHNIHAQKQLEHFLLLSNEFIDIIFDSIKGTGLIILDSSLRVIKNNQAFKKMFELKNSPAQGTKLSEMDNPFWKNKEIRTELLKIFVNHSAMKDAPYIFISKKAKEIQLSITSKLIEGKEKEKQLLLVITSK